MAGLPTGGFELSAIPQAPVWPTNIGHFDPFQVMQAQGMGADLFEKFRTLPLTQKANDTGLQAQVSGNVAKDVGNQAEQSQLHRQLAFSKAQEANQFQNAADYAKYQSNVFSNLANGNPATFTPFGGMGSFGAQAQQAPSGQTPQSSAAPSTPSDTASATPSAGASAPDTQAAPQSSGPLSQPTAAAPQSTQSGGILSSPAGQPQSQPQSGLGGSPIFGGILSIPQSNGQTTTQVLPPSPILSRMVMGVHPVQVGTDQNGLPLFQNVEDTPLGTKPYGRPFTMTSVGAQGGPAGAPQQTQGAQTQPSYPQVPSGMYQTTQSPKLGMPVEQANASAIPAVIQNPVYSQSPKDASKISTTEMQEAQKAQAASLADWDAANNRQIQIGQALKVADDSFTNPLVPGWVSKLRTGIQPDFNTLSAITNQLALTTRPPGFSRVTNFDLQTFMKANVSANNTPQTNRDLAVIPLVDSQVEKEYAQARMNFAANYHTLNGFDPAFTQYMQDNPIVNGQGKGGANWSLNADRISWPTYAALKNKGIADPNAFIKQNGDQVDINAIPSQGEPAWSGSGRPVKSEKEAVPANSTAPAPKDVPDTIKNNKAYEGLVSSYQSGKPVSLKGQMVKITGFTPDGGIQYEAAN